MSRVHETLDPMAQAEVESEIRRLSRELEKLSVAIGDAATRAAQADVDYKREYARGIVCHRGKGGTVAERDALVHGEVEAEYEKKQLAEAVYRTFQERGRNLRAQLDALRTIAANVRHVMGGQA